MISVDELYEFDLNGYLILRQVLTPAEVARARALLEADKTPKNFKFAFLHLDPFFMDLMAHPKLLELLALLLGDWFRFDHAFGLQMKGDPNVEKDLEGLHAGPLAEMGSFWYQYVDGRMRNGLVKAMFPLVEVRPGDGGLVCVPGSHKANLKHMPPRDSHLVVNPALQAGDMLVFTEALVHGSRSWRGPTTRLALNFSYSPGCLAWRRASEIEKFLPLARTEVQRNLLRPPFVGDYDERDDGAAWTNQWRAATLPPGATQTELGLSRLGHAARAGGRIFADHLRMLKQQLKAKRG